MKIDYVYIESILSIFVEDEKSVLPVDKFNSFIESDDDKFFSHISILGDKRLIIGAGPSSSLGFEYMHDEYQYTNSDWRLTADGHDFALALVKPSVISVINQKFKNEGLSMVIGIAKKITIKQLEKLLDE